MQKCKHCGAVLEDGMLCDCIEAQKERAMVKEAMFVCLKYLAMTDNDNSEENILASGKAFRVVMTELAEKYGQDPREFMEKVIGSMEEFLEEG